ncbi:beta-ketoacyl reductase, partial [Amycolatopsis minnesotensis]|uniref:beta-ketoacyl reductase n=1 Tax=Amycolatopsis minnesotensis TaxID=337894 RepID=UPI0031E07E6D
ATHTENTTGATVVPTLRRDDGDWDRFLLSAAQTWVTGTPITWPAPENPVPVALPTYPFRHRDYWPEPVAPAAAVRPGADWRYRISWKALETGPLVGAAGRRVVVLPDHGDEAWLAGVLDALRADGEIAEIRGTDQLAAKLAEAGPCDAVLSLLGTTPGEDSPGVALAWTRTVAFTKAVSEAGPDVPIWHLTRAATGDGADPVQSGLSGLLRVITLETGEPRVGSIDLPESPDAAALAWALRAAGDEDQLAVRGRRVLARRLVRDRGDTAVHEAVTFDGATLVTGGTGGIGPRLVRRLADRGATTVVLASRSGGQAPGVAGLRAELAERGVRVEAVSCDVSDRDATLALAGQLREQGVEVRSVFHAAGVVDTVPIAGSDLSEWPRVCAAKVLGARNLDEAFGADLDAFVVFSSNAGVWGSAGQSAYAAANAFLDGFVRELRARGRHALSIAWGAWGEVGMATEETASLELSRRGVRPMPPETALDVLEDALAADESFLAVADLDWERFAATFAATGPRPLIGDIPEAAAALAGPSESGDGFAERLGSLTRAEQGEHLLRLVTTQAAAVLGYAPGELVATEKAFRDLGFDSLTAVDLRNALGRATGLALPATLIFDHPNATALAGHLHRQLIPTTTHETIHTGLDQLESSLAELRCDQAERGQIARRLRHLAEHLVDEHDATTPDGDDLEAAGADELLALIQSEFGRG